MTSTGPMAFPPLPQHSLGWSADIHTAHEIVKKTYDEALRVLRSDGFPDPIRVSFHIDALTSTALPILEALPSGAGHEDECLPDEWVVGVAGLIEQAVQNLREMEHVVSRLSVQFSARGPY